VEGVLLKMRFGFEVHSKRIIYSTKWIIPRWERWRFKIFFPIWPREKTKLVSRLFLILPLKRVICAREVRWALRSCFFREETLILELSIPSSISIFPQVKRSVW
jgi:hypothetical protein